MRTIYVTQAHYDRARRANPYNGGNQNDHNYEILVGAIRLALLDDTGEDWHVNAPRGKSKGWSYYKPVPQTIHLKPRLPRERTLEQEFIAEKRACSFPKTPDMARRKPFNFVVPNIVGRVKKK